MRSVMRAKVEIVEICRYLACEQERRTKRVVAGIRHGPIERGKKETWFVQLDIPPVPPSGLVYCDIIHLEYYISEYLKIIFVFIYFVQCALCTVHFAVRLRLKCFGCACIISSSYFAKSECLN